MTRAAESATTASVSAVFTARFTGSTDPSSVSVVDGMSRVYIGGLPERAGARDIEKLFEKYGRVRGINVKSGFAFIEYEDGRDADDAVYDLDGKNFMGER